MVKFAYCRMKNPTIKRYLWSTFFLAKFTSNRFPLSCHCTKLIVSGFEEWQVKWKFRPHILCADFGQTDKFVHKLSPTHLDLHCREETFERNLRLVQHWWECGLRPIQYFECLYSLSYIGKQSLQSRIQSIKLLNSFDFSSTRNQISSIGSKIFWESE